MKDKQGKAIKANDWVTFGNITLEGFEDDEFIRLEENSYYKVISYVGGLTLQFEVTSVSDYSFWKQLEELLIMSKAFKVTNSVLITELNRLNDNPEEDDIDSIFYTNLN